MKGYPSITPLLWYQDPVAALAWLERAFGFETRMVVDDGKGGVIHSESVFGDCLVMVVGPPNGTAASPAGLAGRHTASVHLQVPDGVDTHCERARAAGAAIQREPATQPYGDRVYTCLDLEGHPWSVGQTMEDLSPKQMADATGHDIREQL